MNYARETLQIPILPLAFGMTTYTMGPLLGMFLCALLGRGNFKGILIGAIVSFIITMFVRMDVWVLVDKAGLDLSALLSNLPSYYLDGGNLKTTFNSSWMWPIGTFLTLGFGLLGEQIWPKKSD